MIKNWLQEKGRIIGVLLALSVLINVTGGAWGCLRLDDNAAQIRSLQVANDRLMDENQKVRQRIRRDSLVITALTRSQSQAADRISQVLNHDINPDSLKKEVWKYLNSE